MASGLGRELITERRIPPPDAVRVNAVRHPKTSPSALSELLGHVARSRAFKIDGNPTDRAVSGYCGLLRCSTMASGCLSCGLSWLAGGDGLEPALEVARLVHRTFTARSEDCILYLMKSAWPIVSLEVIQG